MSESLTEAAREAMPAGGVLTVTTDVVRLDQKFIKHSQLAGI